MLSFNHVLLLALIATLAFGQAPTGEIAGTIYDSTGAVLPNATVTARNAGTGFERTVKSNQEGQYSVTSLAAGPYEIRAQAAGFHTSTTTTTVATGSVATVDLRLQVGELGGDAFEAGHDDR